jgi:hypothetical protein
MQDGLSTEAVQEDHSLAAVAELEALRLVVTLLMEVAAGEATKVALVPVAPLPVEVEAVPVVIQ